MTFPRDSLLPNDSSSGDPDKQKAPADQNDPTLGDQTMIERNSSPVDPDAKTDPGEASNDPLQRGPARSVATVAEFMESISLSGLMSREELEQIQEELNEPGDPKTFADTLVRQRKLTTYQASVLQRGHVRGLVIGNYEVLDRIGHGGMGVVYRARHRRMRREVALKILPSAVSGKTEGVDRFAREVQAAARLQHPNICSAFDADIQSNLHYLAMELVDGPNLSGYVKEAGPLPVAVAVQLVLQAVHGLQYAHAQGVVHRDIKPGNLLVNRDGVLKILDMGLAQFSGNSDDPNHAELTQSGRIMGTVDYMAPEQAVDAKSVDHRADIYSVGCTLYYLLAGEPMSPPGPLTKKLLWHQNSPPPSLRGVRPEVPPRLDEVYLKMVAKSPDERQQTMGEVADDLESVLAELSYSDLQLPLVGITLNSSSGSGSGSSRPSQSSPLLLAAESSAETSSHSQTVSMASQARPRYTAAYWAAMAGGAAALIALAIYFSNGWNQADRPAVTTSPGGDSLNPRLPPADPSPPSTPPRDAWETIAAPASEPARHGRLLAFVFDRGGAVDVAFEGGDQTKQFDRMSSELAQPFQLRGIQLDGRPLADDDLQQLLSAGDELENLSLARTSVTDADVELLQQFPRLLTLNLSHTPITRTAVEYLARLSELRHLDLAHTDIDDNAIEYLIALGNLESLNLAGTQITSAGAKRLDELEQLATLNLLDTMVTAEALAHLRERQSLDVKGFPDADRDIAQLVQQAGGTVTVRYLGDDQSRTLAPQMPFRPRRFAIEAIDLRDAGPQQDDALLTRFLPLKQLKTIHLGQGDYTLPGLAALVRVESLETLNIGELQLDGGVAALRTAVDPVEVEVEEPAAVIVARWALNHGGEIAIRQGESTHKIADLDALPNEPFELAAVKRGTEAKLSDQQLAAVAKLATLENLSLAGSPLTASQLAEVAACASLTQLDLSGTAANATTISALESLPHLRVLRLNRVPLTGAELAALSRLDPLEELELGESSLTAELLAAWKTPANLKRLSLTGNEGLNDAAQPALAQLNQLASLDLTGTSLTDAAGEELKASLKEVNVEIDPLDKQRLAGRWFMENGGVVEIDGESVSDKRLLPRDACVVTAVDLHFAPKQLPIADLAMHVGNCPNLVRANLSGQSIGDSVLAALLKSTDLESLELAGSSLSDAGFRSLVKFSKLRLLDVSANLGIRGSSMAVLAELPQLEQLSLSGLPLTDADLAAISRLAHLRGLNLALSNVGNSGMTHLKGLPLAQLNLHATKVGDAGLAAISTLKLATLDLSHTAVSDAGLGTLAKMNTLRRLDLSQTRVTMSGVDSLRASLKDCNIMVRSYRSEEGTNQVPYSGGGIFGGASAEPPPR